MSTAYEETLGGRTLWRSPPGERHETICARLHARLARGLQGNAVTRLLEPRSPVQLSTATRIRPDVALVTSATGKLWLAVEIINPEDHHSDTVLKKSIYEDYKVTRLWMVDPRYDNAELYHATSYGMALKGILAGSELLQEPLLPGFAMTIAELFDA
jgi:Uma2 family endonuclease